MLSELDTSNFSLDGYFTPGDYVFLYTIIEVQTHKD